MKKLLIALSIILCLSLLFVACKKNQDDDTDTEGTTKKNPTEVTDVTDEETTLLETEDNSSNATTEETSGIVSTEEATSNASTEETTSAESTETETETETENREVIELMSSVDEAMEALEFFERAEITEYFMDGQSTSVDKTVVRFDGYYSYISNYIDDEKSYDMYLIDNSILLYNDPFSGDLLINLSENELNYVTDEIIFQTSEDNEGSYTEMLNFFKTVTLSDNASGGYDLSFANPTDEFLKSALEEVADLGVEIINVNYLFKINSDYTAHAVIMEMTMSFMGMEMTSTVTQEYKYDEFFLDDEIADNFDGYTVVEFEDIFGYIDTSYGKDLGLDIQGDNFVLDYKNEARLIRQIDFLNTFIDNYLDKTFTIYGNIFASDDEYSIETANGYMYFDIVLDDGMEYLEHGTLAVVTGKLTLGTVEFDGEEYPVYYIEVTSANAIDEADIPEGGYLPWTAFVTARSLNVRSTPDFSSTANNKVGVLTADTEIKIVGFIEPKYCMIEYHWETEDGQSGEYAYCSLAYLAKIPSYYLTLDDGYKPVNPPV